MQLADKRREEKEKKKTRGSEGLSSKGEGKQRKKGKVVFCGKRSYAFLFPLILSIRSSWGPFLSAL